MNFPPLPIYTNDDNQTIREDLCAICLDSLTVNPTHTLRECNHVFHASCLIEALRENKSCPLCRGNSQGTEGKIPHSGVILRQIIAYSKSKKNKNKRLKALIHQYEIEREACKSTAKKYREFNKEHNKILQRLRKLKHEKWKTMRNFWGIKRVVCNLPIMPINK